tara:strand:+ start:19043 stop:22162 length:3120 start_codon:yes stop_codon:yes gene_type:complete
MACFQTGLAGKSAAGAAVDPVTRSLRLVGPASSSSSNQNETCNLKRTFSSAGNRKIYTVAFWVKRSSISNAKQILFSSGGSGDSNTNEISFRSNDTLEFYLYPSTSMSRLATAAKFRDVSAWYHVTVAVDTTQATAANRVKMFVNGVQQTFETHTTYPDQNDQSHFNDNREHKFGEEQHRNRYNAEVLLADCYFIDGSAIEPVGNFIEDTGYSSYKPKAFDMSSYGGNSFHLDMQPSHDSDLLVSSVGRNDGDTLFADMAAGHTITRYGNTHHDNTVGNPFGSGTAMYFDGSGDYLQTSTSSDLTFGTGDFTVETWFYPTTVDTSTGYKGIISDELYSSTGGWAVSQRDDELSLWVKDTGGSWVSFVADGALTASQWQHIAVSYDSSSTTTRLFVDGTVVASGTTSGWNLTGDQIEIGRSVSGQEITGYLFDARATKGTARYTSNFTAPTAAFELNPVYIGGDQSGNKNHFQPTGIDSTDTREDNPFKNHATWNPLIKRSSTSNIFTYSEGNTVATYTGGVAHTSTTIASSGVHYAEFAFSGGTSSISGAGVVRARWNGGHADSYTTNYGGCYYGSDGNVDSPSGSTSVAAVGSNRLGIAFDGANNKADFYEVESDGTKTLLKSLTSSDSIDFDGSATFTATSHDSGATSITGYFEAGEWWGTAPSVGSTTATSLNTSNLGTPTVNPEEYFLTATYTGAGGSEEINLGFTPDLTWIKRREDSGYYHGLYDSARGLSSGALASNTTDSEDSTQRVASFDSNAGSEGFTLASSHSPYTNTSGKGYVSWNWKESASAGFDIVTYEGDSDTEDDTQDISHSLGVAPEMIIVKARDGRAYNDYYAEDNWYVWHKHLTSGHSINLNYNVGEVDYSSYGTEPISSVGSSTFTVCNSVDYDNYYYDFLNWGDPNNYYTGNNERYVAYLFSGVEGFSKFGTYEGNNSTDGPFIYCGFRPSWIMTKRIDGTSSWAIVDTARDPHNDTDKTLASELSLAESSFSSSADFDILSNGFKIRHNTSNGYSNAADTHIFAAFSSSSPFKYANAR